jgi:hypothetical protein
MARLATGVAAAASTGAAQTKGRTVSLHMAEALAVVALLGWRERQREDIDIWWQRGILSVVRGCGQPLDSWPGLGVSLSLLSWRMVNLLSTRLLA